MSMGIYLPNMEMPKDGSCIQIVIDDDGKVYPSIENCIYKTGCIAKAVPVPPHGDLIERDALTISTAVPLDGRPYQYVHVDNIKAAPTIIPASGKNTDVSAREEGE